MIQLSPFISISDDEIELSAIRAQGAGGQNVNKVSSAIHLRFDIQRSSLPIAYKEKLLSLNDTRITKEGVIVIKAQLFRTREQNRENALQRLATLIKDAIKVDKKRRPTKPTKGSQRRRLDSKKKHGQTKAMRAKNYD